MDRVRLGSPVTLVERHANRIEVTANGRTETFDQLVLATHSDQGLAILGRNASDAEREALGAIRYEPNVAVLHSDPALMPRRRRVWSSWNALVSPTDRGPRRASVTYWMNRLQRLDTGEQLFVSLNPIQDPDPALVHQRFDYAHPQFDHRTVDAQRRLTAIQGARRTWFAGAYCGYGFHEDGLQAGLNVAAALGSPSPWWGSFEPMSSSLPPDRIGALV
jgi:predicted NAD/FAD-binding protein